MPARSEPPVDQPPPARRPAASLEEALATYRSPAGHWDELLDEHHGLRREWARFARVTSGRPLDLERAEAQIARQIHDTGATYNVYAAADGPTRPWALDALPTIIGADEWEPLARALRQRARLLNALAADLYGPQQLVTHGLLPPALVLGHPGFVRACHGVAGPDGVSLHHVAFDLGRGPDGQWRVVGTRTQAPSGAGYALENRLTVSRLFPDAFRELYVERLAPFFRTLQAALVEGAPRDGESPHAVVLTPGPYSETYFEHAYLARYLGLTLVQGGDLTVRDDRVYMKTLTGLQRIHAILRRLDDDFCDPLELRTDSALGVPGLVQAWRAGHVLIANPFGVSVLESPGLFGFLPGICRELLGEPLALASLPTWWCGEAAAREDAAARFGAMVIKPARPDVRLEPVFVADLAAAERAAWAARIDEAPDRYVLQEYLPLSHVAAAHGGRLESRALMLRALLVSDGRGDYHVMPGGLSRIAGDEREVVSGQRGGSSKDTWVLSEAPIAPFSLLPGRLEADEVAGSHHPVSSRAAENLFWLGRYTERALNGARLLRAVLLRLSSGDPETDQLVSVVAPMCHRHGLLRAEPEGNASDPVRLEADLIAEMRDRRAGVSVAFNLAQAARAADVVRDRLSADTWRLLNHMFQEFAAPPAVAGPPDAQDLLERAIAALVAASGIETERMTRDDGWRLLSIGRHLERLLSVTRTAAEVATSGDAHDHARLEWLLELSDTASTYRARYMRPPEWLAVADLVLCDRHNPRSVAFQLGKLANQVSLLPEAGLGDFVAGLRRARAECRIAEAPSGGLLAGPRVLDDFLNRVDTLALSLSDAISLRYFSHVYEPTHATAVF